MFVKTKRARQARLDKLHVKMEALCHLYLSGTVLTMEIAQTISDLLDDLPSVNGCIDPATGLKYPD